MKPADSLPDNVLDIRLRLLYNALCTSSGVHEPTRGMTLAMIRDIAEAAGLEWPEGWPAVDRAAAAQAIGPRVVRYMEAHDPPVLRCRNVRVRRYPSRASRKDTSAVPD